MFPSEADQAAIAERHAEYQAADRAALPHLTPGRYVQHTLYPHHRGVVRRTFEDAAGWWMERTDGTIARPRFWVPVREEATVQQKGQTHDLAPRDR